MNTTQPAPTSNSYEKTLRELRKGAAITELSEKLAALLQAVRDTGRPGQLVHKIVVSPASAGDVLTLTFKDKVDTKLPERPLPATIFYLNDDNTVQRTDPRQKEFEISEVPAPQAPPQTAERVA